LRNRETKYGTLKPPRQPRYFDSHWIPFSLFFCPCCAFIYEKCVLISNKFTALGPFIFVHYLASVEIDVWIQLWYSFF
jgi:hypothetical protein